MKKTFKLTHDKIKPARLADAIKSEVKKYIKRERNHALPTGVDFWDFACKFGKDVESSKEIHLAEINQCIDKAEAEQLDTFYLEILAKPGVRTQKPAKIKTAQLLDEDDFEYDIDFEEEYEDDFDHGIEYESDEEVR